MTIALDTFSTQEMVAALEQTKPVKQAFLDLCFRRTETHTTDTISIDFTNHNRHMAQFSRPTDKAVVVDRLGFQAQQFKIPTIREKMALDATQLLNRNAGETIYSGSTPQERAMALRVKDLDYLRTRVLRRMEWMAMKALFTGVVPILNQQGTVNQTLDFGMAASHKITLLTTAKWDDAAGVPLTNFRTWRRLMQQDSGLAPDFVVMAPDTVDIFFANAQVKAYVANSLSRMQRGNINSNVRDAANGLTLIGNIEGIDVYEYVEFFDDDTNSQATTQLLPAKGLLMGSSQADCRRHFGVIQDLSAGVNAVGQWYPKEWIEEDPAIAWLMMHTAPMVGLHQPDAFINVVVA